MDPQGLLALLLLALFSVYSVYSGFKDLSEALRVRRDARLLDRTGVRARGVVTSVHPLTRSPNGHTVTVAFRDADGREREAVDTSGLGGYLVREGTPVELLHSADDPRLVRVESAALPGPSAEHYPVRPGRRPGGAKAIAAAVLTMLAVPAFTAVIAALALSGRDGGGLFRYLPFLFTVVGLGMLLSATVSAVRDRAGGRGYTGEADGTVIDSWREASRATVNGRRVYTHPFTVHFSAGDGREVHRRYRRSSTSYRPVRGQSARVRYDLRAPARFSVPEAHTWGCGPGAVMVVVGLGFVIIGTFVGLMFLLSGSL
ncbi:DUF3592 domain-containing protein [Nocardiopsis sp. HUAS JQ3]|uniref:DUF3592 domain-containing protein n=1 Tax=Nocardiopsis sp. HUAS JQ3 TaxID=3061629 RepID=UPI0023A932F6|nr:DUF3592 domain-containing protein [Nocardiopsis sp. HUAS JQ3]WDZ93735.1 hypothetical protein PV789_14840 [Nocardiopsis sp. HUAS JQ3]